MTLLARVAAVPLVAPLPFELAVEFERDGPEAWRATPHTGDYLAIAWRATRTYVHRRRLLDYVVAHHAGPPLPPFPPRDAPCANLNGMARALEKTLRLVGLGLSGWYDVADDLSNVTTAHCRAWRSGGPTRVS